MKEVREGHESRKGGANHMVVDLKESVSGTLASFSFSHFGVIKYRMPSKAPGRVTPLISRMTSTT